MGVEKSLMDFGGAPIITRVIERFAPQVSALAINANGDPARFAMFRHPVIADACDERPGPLAGIVAGLAFARESKCAFLATAPCDAPFVPHDFVARLLARCSLDGVALASSKRGTEPLFGVWSVNALPRIEAALKSGERAVHRVAAALGAVHVEIEAKSDEPDWALNLNRREDVDAALASLARKSQ
jgi:molybdopterin-guanine dinucleotide biosynthesis protein A